MAWWVRAAAVGALALACATTAHARAIDLFFPETKPPDALAPVDPATKRAHFLVGIKGNEYVWGDKHAAEETEALGVPAINVTLDWYRGAQPANPVRNAPAGAKVILTVTGPGKSPPVTEVDRAEFCGYAAKLVRRVPNVVAVAIWNEPMSHGSWEGAHNLMFRDYTLLLARCWDTLHPLGVKVIGPGDNCWYRNAELFAEAMVDTMKAIGRNRPVLDVWDVHPYATFDQLPVLVRALDRAFAAGPQPGPSAGLPVWVTEVGVQSNITQPDKRGYYFGTERGPYTVADEGEQARVEAARMISAFCTPGIEAYFHFLLYDERDLRRWQSGLLYADETRKPAFYAFRETFQRIESGRIICN